MNFWAASSARNWSGTAWRSCRSTAPAGGGRGTGCRRASRARSAPEVSGRAAAGRGRRGGQSRRGVIELLEFAQTNGLRDSVLGDREVLGLQPFDRLAVLVRDRDGLDHQLRRTAGTTGRLARICGCCAAGGQHAAREQRQRVFAWLRTSPAWWLCTLRIGLAVTGRPNCALVTMVFQLGKVTWFSALVASSRRSALIRSLRRKVRASEAFSENCAGPVMELRPALPHWPGGGRRKRGGVQEQARRRVIERRARVVGPDAAGHARAAHGGR